MENHYNEEYLFLSFISYWFYCISSQDLIGNIFLTYFSTQNITLICKLVETNRDKMFLFKNYLSIIAIIFLLEVFSCHQLENDLIISSRSNLAIRMKLKRPKSRVLYYPNTTAAFNVILQAGDIESNPGPGFSPPKCSIFTKTARCNEKQLICKQCFESTHARCANFKNVRANNPTLWTCSHCLLTVLPFLNHSLNSSASSKNLIHLIDLTDEDILLLTLNTNKNNLKILHINTQLTSSFDEFLLQRTKYNFDIVAV